MRPDRPRDPVTGPDEGPESPYPIRMSGPVIKGFGRGSKEVPLSLSNPESKAAPADEKNHSWAFQQQTSPPMSSPSIPSYPWASTTAS